MTVSILTRNIGPHLGFYPGEYTTTTVMKPTAKSSRRQEPVMLSAVDLKRLVQQMDGVGVEERVRQMQKADRDRRHALSKTRIANWTHTVGGQRKQRLQARADRLEAEEAKRVRIDELYAEEEAQRRKAIIDRAKQMQYCETDCVKRFHSKVMLFETLRERDMQLELKRRRVQEERERDYREDLDEVPVFARPGFNPLQAQIDARVRDIEVANCLLEQQREKRDREREEVEQRAAATNPLSESSDRAFQSKEAQYAAKRAAQREFKHQLDECASDRLAHAEAERRAEEVRQAKAADWRERKTRQVNRKKQLETERKIITMQSNHEAGEKIAAERALQDAKLEAAVAKAMADRGAREKLQEEKEKAKRRKQGLDIEMSYREQKAREKATHAAQQVEDAQALQTYLQIQAATLAERARLQEERREKARVVQEENLKTSADHTAYAQLAHTTSLTDRQTLEALTSLDDTHLHAYMQSLASEPWAQPNTRLQTYVRVETDPNRRALQSTHVSGWMDTGRRLGLTTRVDRERAGKGTGEIGGLEVRGSAADVAGSASHAISHPETPAASRPQSCAKVVKGGVSGGVRRETGSRPTSSLSLSGAKAGGGEEGLQLPMLPVRK
ncbi:uncharacterized protein EV422DRAFT_79352 [Fimicolochytrium jonesii]|uniref:uncharacterized protein n=1 Tax=Fimicolochytrium jonesii TaxID=1396493 RepID=UPI0022FDD1C4|nr:uncharacterized protein EV422DRAFT_79352 [Fimicolochytrium jonesii]KAI8820119.1 hypothetical protein EV422DRAFT_79352 [Fimicolochytrium jonesii]